VPPTKELPETIGGPDAPTKCHTPGTKSYDSTRCTCKSNCDGDLCDQCKYGAFDGPSENHPGGCLSCWCAETTQRCDPSNFRYTKLEPSLSDSFVLVSQNPNSNVLDQLQPATLNQMANKGYHAETRGKDNCYWYMPDRFLGNKLRTYGGEISFTSIVDGSRRTEQDADIIIRGNGKRLEYTKSDNSPKFNVKIAENQGWKTNGMDSSRGEIMTALTKIDSILIRACSGRTTYSRFSDMSIDYANGTTGTGETATSVERCQCPTGYRGLSCEDCAPGYYRIDGPGLGMCEKCNCGGDNECDDFTGLCKV